MSENNKRLDLRFTKAQMQFLRKRAKQINCSVGDVLREIISREYNSEHQRATDNVAKIKSMAGAFKDTMPLINGIAVSENVDLYLTQAALDNHTTPESKRPNKRPLLKQLTKKRTAKTLSNPKRRIRKSK
jgi:hypothetical protein